jgi:hypothetical protein
MKAVFIDTGAFVAKEIARDQHHDPACETWESIALSGVPLFSSEHVLDESATLLARRTNYAFAGDWGRDALESGVEWLSMEVGDLERAFGLMRKFADQGVSFTDAVSFVLMKRHKIRHAFAFDRHFAAAGFRILPDF